MIAGPQASIADHSVQRFSSMLHVRWAAAIVRSDAIESPQYARS